MMEPSGENATLSTSESTVTVDRSVSSVNFSPCGNKLAASCNNYGNDSFSVKIFRKAGSTGIFECQSTLTGHSRPVTSVAWNNDGTKLVSGSSDRTVKIWSVGSAGTFECQSTLSGHSDW